MKPSPFSFETLQRNDKPNSYLICPKDLCTTNIDEMAPVFNVGISELQKAWNTMMTSQPRIKVLTSNSDNYTYQYVQRSFLLRFPDIINVKLIPINDSQSTLAIYSHAVYGYYDFNVNKNRVKKWLGELETAINADSSATHTQ